MKPGMLHYFGRSVSRWRTMRDQTLGARSNRLEESSGAVLLCEMSHVTCTHPLRRTQTTYRVHRHN